MGRVLGGGGVDPGFIVCPPGQGLVDGSDDCVQCNEVLEGSAPNPETGECECLSNQIPSEDGKCECPDGFGWLEGSDKCVSCYNSEMVSLDNQCVECDTVLEGSIFYDFPTVECKCPENKILSKDETKCECPEGEIPNVDGKTCDTPKSGWCAIPCWIGYTNDPENKGAGCDVRCEDGGCNDAWCDRVCYRSTPHPACKCEDPMNCLSVTSRITIGASCARPSSLHLAQNSAPTKIL